MALDEDTIQSVPKAVVAGSVRGSLREYAWQYFLVHAQARLTTFRFYVVFCTIICTGLVAILSQGGHPQVGAPLAFLLALLSFVYWKVDVRHKGMIKHAEAALRWVEKETDLPDIDGAPHPLKLFTREDHIVSQLPRFPATWNPLAFWSYSTCVNVIFLLFGVGGVVAGIWLLVTWR
jgi:hypothetical protein